MTMDMSMSCLLLQVAEGVTDEEQKAALQRLANKLNEPTRKQIRYPQFASEILESHIRHWPDGRKEFSQYIKLAQAALGMLENVSDGEWWIKDVKKGTCKNMVSYRKFAYFKHRALRAEDENKKLRDTIKTLFGADKLPKETK